MTTKDTPDLVAKLRACIGEDQSVDWKIQKLTQEVGGPFLIVTSDQGEWLADTNPIDVTRVTFPMT